MTSDSQFNSIRPYMGEEIPAAVERLSQAEEFLALFSQMTRIDKTKIQEQLKGITTRKEFQERFFGPTMKRLIAGTTDGVTATGLEYIEPGKSYLFVSNHRVTRQYSTCCYQSGGATIAKRLSAATC